MEGSRLGAFSRLPDLECLCAEFIVWAKSRAAILACGMSGNTRSSPQHQKLLSGHLETDAVFECGNLGTQSALCKMDIPRGFRLPADHVDGGFYESVLRA